MFRTFRDSKGLANVNCRFVIDTDDYWSLNSLRAECSVPRIGARRLLVDLAMRHVAETAPFPAPPLDLDENEHASRRISTPLITMGLLSRKRSVRLDEMV